MTNHHLKKLFIKIKEKLNALVKPHNYEMTKSLPTSPLHNNPLIRVLLKHISQTLYTLSLSVHYVLTNGNHILLFKYQHIYSIKMKLTFGTRPHADKQLTNTKRHPGALKHSNVLAHRCIEVMANEISSCRTHLHKFG